MISETGSILLRDLTVGSRSGGNWAQGAIFFILFMMLAAFALGPEQAERAFFAPALVWLAACLASQLSLEQLFSADLSDGSLECWAADNRSFSGYVLGKFLAQWVLAFVPILVLAPIGALMLGAPPDRLLPLMASLVVGGPSLILFGGMASSLAANLRGTGLLIVLLSGPLLASPLIFGVGAAQAGQMLSADLKILGAISLGAAVLCPIISTFALKVHLE